MAKFEDRIAKYPNRYQISPMDGSTPYFVTLKRADDPSVAGTPLNADTFNGMQSDLESKIEELVNGTKTVASANKAVTATNADTATNVTAITNNNNGDNATVKFTIGNKSFEKTVNNVAKADYAAIAGTAQLFTNLPIFIGNLTASQGYPLSSPGIYVLTFNMTGTILGQNNTLTISDLLFIPKNFTSSTIVRSIGCFFIWKGSTYGLYGYDGGSTVTRNDVWYLKLS